ncbi:hypothetical protein BCV70DRAFT_21429 [Testicularia cyperi]|uniref:Uncharacterized protein n=1 Tax=Testicularia cyperi TaxID=1882483 RepID=A0A317Y264_9BASI|nr:hypothetical protein BCV70DRAFT_21429 [Testicularia cyperi]
MNQRQASRQAGRQVDTRGARGRGSESNRVVCVRLTDWNSQGQDWAGLSRASAVLRARWGLAAGEGSLAQSTGTARFFTVAARDAHVADEDERETGWQSETETKYCTVHDGRRGGRGLAPRVPLITSPGKAGKRAQLQSGGCHRSRRCGELEA